jgi:polyisoprenoid-binding protein YceI
VPKIAKVLLIAVVVLGVTVPLGTYAYIHFIEGDTPDRLTFDSTTTAAPTGSTVPTSTTPASLNGTWVATDSSQVGYRVKEKLFGQDTEAVGRTSNVSGELTYADLKVTAAKITADMTTVKSDQSNRDNQFRTRIMDTSTYPTAVFELTKPIALPQVPTADPMTVTADGNLTLRGVTQPVTVELKIRKNGDAIEANGTIPVTFSKWNIPNPSFGPAETADNGELELLVSFKHQ